MDDSWWRKKCLATETKYDNMNSEGCTSADVKGKCSVHKGIYGYSFEASTSSYKFTDVRVTVRASPRAHGARRAAATRTPLARGFSRLAVMEVPLPAAREG